MNPSSHLAVYGAAFNPPHLGHQDVVRQLLDAFDTVLVIPAAAHAFGKQMAPFDDRLAMTQLLFQEMAPRVQVSAIEQELLRENQPVYTYDLLSEVRLRTGVAPIFVIGPDNADPAVWAKFYRAEDIAREFGCVVAEERLPIRSTQIRKQVEAGAGDLVAQVGAPVAAYLAARRLYG